MEFLKKHLEKYPFSELCDAVKLFFQSTFGADHLLIDTEASFLNLSKERAALSKKQIEPIEEIGGGFCRVNLCNETVSAISDKTLHSLFVLSNENTKKCGDISLFLEKCKKLDAFWGNELDSYLDKLSKEGFPPVSHSMAYKKAYDPHYRVMKYSYAKLIFLLEKIDVFQNEKDNVTVAIDGRCAGGKSTLAKVLSKIYDCNVFHADDYFLTPDLRTKERLFEVGGNFDRVRFENEILKNIGTDFDYYAYNCSTGKMEKRSSKRKKINVIEGSYSHHPDIKKYYDISVFVDVDESSQIERIRKRNGEAMLARFVSEWIKKEEAYFDKFSVKEKSCILFNKIDEL